APCRAGAVKRAAHSTLTVPVAERTELTGLVEEQRVEPVEQAERAESAEPTVPGALLDWVGPVAKRSGLARLALMAGRTAESGRAARAGLAAGLVAASTVAKPPGRRPGAPGPALTRSVRPIPARPVDLRAGRARPPLVGTPLACPQPPRRLLPLCGARRS
ncbi:MAG: hypothetical protein LBG11_08350, partial [Bifidobacteriaceae bacterium]|nr:hypothetical protein [Bifidobacteriaceae bacterium]